MSYEILTTPQFDREVKRLCKKYSSLKEDLASLGHQLEENPIRGDPLGNDLFKVRFSISSKNRGKSGGGRVITLIKRIDQRVYLIAIYDKSEISSISKQKIKEMLKDADLLTG